MLFSWCITPLWKAADCWSESGYSLSCFNLPCICLLAKILKDKVLQNWASWWLKEENSPWVYLLNWSGNILSAHLESSVSAKLPSLLRMQTIFWLGTTRVTNSYISSLCLLVFVLSIVHCLSNDLWTAFVHQMKLKWFGSNTAGILTLTFTCKRSTVPRVTKLYVVSVAKFW